MKSTTFIKNYEGMSPNPNRVEGGLRIRSNFHNHSKPNKPLVSIVTIVLNGEKTLERTIQSVLNQTYDNIEYIIIDGGSTDGTLDIIQRYEDTIAYWMSEPDEGIYDAMNKGIYLATGEWINFMNAGDSFYKEDVVQDVIENAPADIDLIYGNSQKEFNGFSRIQIAGELKDLWKSTIFWHQCLFTKTKLMKENLFNPDNKIVADYEFTLKSYYDKRKFYKSNIIIACVSAGGMSDANRIQAIKSRWQIIKTYNHGLIIDIYYSWLLITTYIRIVLKKILPLKLVTFILKNKKSSV